MAWVPRHHPGTATGVAHTARPWVAALLPQVSMLAFQVTTLHFSFGWVFLNLPSSWSQKCCCQQYCQSYALWKHGTTQVNKPKLLGEGVWVEREEATPLHEDRQENLVTPRCRLPLSPQNHTWITLFQVKQAQFVITESLLQMSKYYWLSVHMICSEYTIQI